MASSGLMLLALMLVSGELYDEYEYSEEANRYHAYIDHGGETRQLEHGAVEDGARRRRYDHLSSVPPYRIDDIEEALQKIMPGNRDMTRRPQRAATDVTRTPVSRTSGGLYVFRVEESTNGTTDSNNDQHTNSDRTTSTLDQTELDPELTEFFLSLDTPINELRHLTSAPSQTLSLARENLTLTRTKSLDYMTRSTFNENMSMVHPSRSTFEKIISMVHPSRSTFDKNLLMVHPSRSSFDENILITNPSRTTFYGNNAVTRTPIAMIRKPSRLTMNAPENDSVNNMLGLMTTPPNQVTMTWYEDVSRIQLKKPTNQMEILAMHEDKSKTRSMVPEEESTIHVELTTSQDKSFATYTERSTDQIKKSATQMKMSITRADERAMKINRKAFVPPKRPTLPLREHNQIPQTLSSILESPFSTKLVTDEPLTVSHITTTTSLTTDILSTMHEDLTINWAYLDSSPVLRSGDLAVGRQDTTENENEGVATEDRTTIPITTDHDITTALLTTSSFTYFSPTTPPTTPPTAPPSTPPTTLLTTPPTTPETTPPTTLPTIPPTTKAPEFDVDMFLDILSNLTYDYDTNLTHVMNMTLQRVSAPTCGTPKGWQEWMGWPNASFDKVETTEPWYEAPKELNNSVIAKVQLGFQYPPQVYIDTTSLSGPGMWGAVGCLCFVCGLKETGVPRSTDCADAFAGDFLPLVPVNPLAKSKAASYRKYCRYGEIYNWYENVTRPKSLYGRWTGGCSVRWTDLTGLYTQRTCRNRRRPITGDHYASKRMAKLEMALSHLDTGCMITPVATLLPLSRGISLYSRFHACVCSGNWCNGAARAHPATLTVLTVLTVLAPAAVCTGRHRSIY